MLPGRAILSLPGLVAQQGQKSHFFLSLRHQSAPRLVCHNAAGDVPAIEVESEQFEAWRDKKNRGVALLNGGLDAQDLSVHSLDKLRLHCGNSGVVIFAKSLLKILPRPLLMFWSFLLPSK